MLYQDRENSLPKGTYRGYGYGHSAGISFGIGGDLLNTIRHKIYTQAMVGLCYYHTSKSSVGYSYEQGQYGYQQEIKGIGESVGLDAGYDFWITSKFGCGLFYRFAFYFVEGWSLYDNSVNLKLFINI